MHCLQKNPDPGGITKKSAVKICAIAFAVALLDGVFKFLANNYLPDERFGVSWPLDLALHKNPGITFDLAIPLLIVLPLTALICLVLLHYAYRERIFSPVRSASAITIVCGALGNGVDRLVNHYTTDYLIIFSRSAINLSDLLIVIGAIGLLYYTEINLPAGANH